MRFVAAIFSCFLLAGVVGAQEPGGSICRVNVLRNSVDIPQDSRDGIVLLRVFVSTSGSCLSGEVEVAAFPTDVCTKEPATDINNAAAMTFTYKPAVLKLAVQPGNISSGVIDISSDSTGRCTFNTHVASCGSVVPSGGNCVTRDLTDPGPEDQGAITQEFNRLR